MYNNIANIVNIISGPHLYVTIVEHSGVSIKLKTRLNELYTVSVV